VAYGSLQCGALSSILPNLRALQSLAAQLLLAVLCALGPPQKALAANEDANQRSHAVDFRGWGHLVARLEELGVDAVTLREIYSDQRMPRFGSIPFSVAPREPRSLYAGFLTAHRLELAQQFMALHHPTLSRAAKQFNVTSSVITAILLVESSFGLHTGQELVLYRLSRIAGLNTHENIEYNFHRLRKTDSSVTREKLHARAGYLHRTFTPEIVALITMVRKNNLDIFQIRGSIAGAFGIPQFLPSSYLRFGIDGNGDGAVSLYNPDDAIHSAAHFLAEAGWHDTITPAEKRQVIWRYNKSDEYISTVLDIAERLQDATKQTRR